MAIRETQRAHVDSVVRNPVHENGTAPQFVETGQQEHQSALPAPVGSEHGHCVTAADPEAHAGHERRRIRISESDIVEAQIVNPGDDFRSLRRLSRRIVEQRGDLLEGAESHANGGNSLHKIANLGGKQGGGDVKGHHFAPRDATVRNSLPPGEQDRQSAHEQDDRLKQLMGRVEAREFERRMPEFPDMAALPFHFHRFGGMASREIHRRKGEADSTAEVSERNPQRLLAEPDPPSNQPVGNEQHRRGKSNDEGITRLDPEQQDKQNQRRKRSRENRRGQGLVSRVHPVCFVDQCHVKMLDVGAAGTGQLIQPLDRTVTDIRKDVLVVRARWSGSTRRENGPRLQGQKLTNRHPEPTEVPGGR